MQMLEEYVSTKDKFISRRCKYVVEENMRLQSGCKYFKNGNVKA